MSDFDTWTVINTSAAAHTLGQWNSVCTISNGYVGLKGNLAEHREGPCPTTLINGVYDELDMFGLLRLSAEERRYLDPRYFDSAGKSPAVANLPDPLFVQVFVNERELSIGRGELLDFAQMLDLRTGVYRYRFDYRDGQGHTTRIEMERFASLRHAHRVFMRYRVTPLDHQAPIRVHSGINARVHSNLTGERQFRISNLWCWPPEVCRLIVLTPARNHEVRLAVRNRLLGPPASAGPAGVAEHDAAYTRYVFEAAPRGQTITLERYIVLACSEDLRHGVTTDWEAELRAAEEQGFAAALAEQAAAWEELWSRCDVQIEDDAPAQLGLRFCLYHLLAAAPRFSDRLSVPVKLLSGDYYQGNTFYDTDLYIVPFYTFTRPELARTCLNFRYEGLRAGREIARNLGYDGAKLAWQAGPYGEECLGLWWRFTHTNIHINADVAYALMQYYRASGDETFMAERGVDLLVETARFFASRAVYDRQRDAFDIHDVAGPDEGHCESTNNFYTNVMAIRNLRWAADLLELLASTDPQTHAAVVRRLAIRSDEPGRWRHVAERLTLLFDPQTGRYEQYAGFYQLKPIPADLLAKRREWFVTVAPYQALNQPDVLMALALLRDEFDRDVLRANWEYYRDKSMNFSSMSFVINSLMAAELGELEEAYKHFVITTGMDLDEQLTGRRDTHQGLHGTAMGGAWLAAVGGFGGFHLGERGPRLDPRLPDKWSALRFNLMLRGQLLDVAIDRQYVTVTPAQRTSGELWLSVSGQPVRLAGGQPVSTAYSSATR